MKHRIKVRTHVRRIGRKRIMVRSHTKRIKARKNFGGMKTILRKKEGTTLQIPHSVVSSELAEGTSLTKFDFITLPITPQKIIDELRTSSPKDFADASIARRQAKQVISGKSKLSGMSQQQIIDDFVKQREELLKKKNLGSFPKEGIISRQSFEESRKNLMERKRGLEKKLRITNDMEIASIFEDLKLDAGRQGEQREELQNQIDDVTNTLKQVNKILK